MKGRALLFTAFGLLAATAAAAQPRVVAHRGHWLAEGATQNSLASFAAAAELGLYGSEMDVWLTADDGLVVAHDRVYGDTQIDMERDKERIIRSIVLPNGENIPSLDAYLRTVREYPQTRLVLELKSLTDLRREDRAAAKIVRMIRRYGLEKRTDYIAFSINACLAFRKEAPDSRVFYLEGDLAPHRVKTLGLTGIDYSKEVLRAHPEWVAEAHGEGLEVNVWTVNDEADMRYFVQLGVDYITTDRPEVLLRLLGGR